MYMAYVALSHPSTFDEDLQNKIDLILTNMLTSLLRLMNLKFNQELLRSKMFTIPMVMKNTSISIFLRMRIKCCTNISQQDLN